MGSLKRNLANNILSGGKFDATDLSGTVPASNVNNDSLTNLTTFGPSLGDTIQSVASDPPSLSEGDFWYNTTTGSLKGLVQIKAASSGGNMGTARYGVGGAGTQTAGLAFTGSPGSSPYLSNATEEYNGFSWASGGNYPTNTRYAHGAGTQTAALGFMSDVSPLQLSAEYDGSSWTAGNSLTVPRNRGGGSSNSTQTAGLAFGGNPLSNTTEEYDGTSWTAGGNLNTSRRENPGAGTQTAGLAMGGKNAPGGNTTTTETEEYNGTSWTVVSGVLSTGTSNFNNGAGTQSDAALFGGSNTSGTKVSTIQEYDGAVWSNSSATLASNRNSAGIGTRAQGLIFGGLGTTTLNTTEEYNSNINAITQAAFASGGNLNTGRGFAAAATQGSQNSALHFGGWAPPTGARTLTEEYNGTSWSEVNDLGTAQYYIAGAGTQTAALGFGGYTTPPAVITAKTVEYDGTNWANGGDLNVARSLLAGAGTQTAGLAFGGEDTPDRNKVEEYDGTAWTTANTKSTPTGGAAGTGIQTAALSLGGPTVATELYDGTSWTSGGNMNVIRTSVTSATGTQTLGLIAKGNAPPGDNLLTNSEKFDGTTFAASASVTTGAQYASGTGATIGGIVHGGGTPLAGTNSTEEFTDGTEVTTASTITTS